MHNGIETLTTSFSVSVARNAKITIENNQFFKENFFNNHVPLDQTKLEL